MRVHFRSSWAVMFIAAGLAGCDKPAVTPAPAPPDRGINVDVEPGKIDIDGPRRDIDIKTGPGGVDVDVNPKSSAVERRGLDVDVDAGRVDVNVDGTPVRDRIEERRAERAVERATE